jgi:ATP-dependent RNA helicase RhlE
LPTSFENLGLSEHLLRAVEAVGFSIPTPVQAAAIPCVLAGRDVLARAETGSGKTAAFGLPILQQLCESPRERSVRGNHAAVLVLVPTRELAMQIEHVLITFTQPLPVYIKVLAVYGGVSINPQMMDLRGGVDILIATPGRLLDLHRSNAVRFDFMRTLVLDEADRMLSLGFADELTEIFSLLPGRRQNLLFSATFPATLSDLVEITLHDPIKLDVEPPVQALIEQHVYTVDEDRKAALLIHLIKERDMQQVLVFVSMKKTADHLLGKLKSHGISTAVFHSDKSQAERSRVLSDFRAGTLCVLIATDLAARGIDIDELPTVINFELPRSPNDYLHRIGRTGRAGNEGLAISLICPDEYHHFSVIEKRMKQRLTREQVPGFEAS